jgi:hypothetical protein
MPRKLSLTFHHETGPRCIVSLEENGAAVRVTYSLRSADGIPVHLASRFLTEWQSWFAQVMKCPPVPPALPLGWR